MAKTESKQPGFLKREIKMNKKHTIASIIGNYIGLLAIFIANILMLYELFRKTNPK